MHKKIQEISKGLKSNFFYNYDLYKSTWFQAGGNCDFFCIVENINELKKILKSIGDIPYFVIGSGSNLLIRDGGYKGLIIKLGKSFNKIYLQNNEIISGAGILDVNLSKFAYINSIKNFEFYSGIPGNIGGAIKMNAGCFGNETKNILNSVTVINKNGEEELIKNKLLNFGYRNSDIKNEIIVSASFNAEVDDKNKIKFKIEEIKQKRKLTQPIKFKTGGSTFKNPSSYFAAELIEKSECKGLNVGDAYVSDKHSNFLINKNNASAGQIEDLGKMIIERVYEKFGILLEWEIKIIGNYK
ncbi:MAG: UDP-N-acetylenolpyruvoylglucosamine reductase [Alphaproteobacteria bacterium MarineAlpha5_Bin8]|nr:MAG: UDP-N-acetylenolpyruvoylglucosamine reductase [Alphaproteobacteria bacterium MarineAlpha5_Bin7]PPR48239.1 MAG: UDP-N-acetylenolpyruvoylglucosamine reductase [Alphaproteobacteria bacterium MarineAlpha5_Bin8]PPR54457.1 MAG: UDP-N-acetylenolpyruvoylglucosamine reductase [Alphaproteobacteria bacterium MarineAlpha5_Bin6]|tara:strand:- start:6993 stop:7889 length:897 start_codon:yes stop_codon:yes gene_type:complete